MLQALVEDATQCRAWKVIQKIFLEEKLPLALGGGVPGTGVSECQGTEAGTSWLILSTASSCVYLEGREGGRRQERMGLGKQLAARLW